MKCSSCGSELELFYSSPSALSATSDCRDFPVQSTIYRCTECRLIQKIISGDYRSNIKKIYDIYSLYHLSGGKEQVKFSKGNQKTRSSILISNISSQIAGSESLLDIGAGRGNLLSELHSFMPNITLYANEINLKSVEMLSKLHFIKNVYPGNIADIEDTFDAITLIHSFEHVTDLNVFVPALKKLCGEKGVVVIQVPDVSMNPFDILIYDHCWHFTKMTLLNVLNKFFSNVALCKDQITNEITCFATDNHDFTVPADIELTDSVDTGFLDRTHSLMNNVDENVYVFGTGPAGIYCAEYLNKNCAGFLDEDTSKLGAVYNGKTIIHPSDCDRNIPVFIPMSMEKIRDIHSRYPFLKIVNLRNELC